MLWLKAFHVIFVVTWFAGLFYLPRLFLYHVGTEDPAGQARFITMERKLFVMTTIGGSFTVLFGLAMVMMAPSYLQQGWLHVKLTLVLLLIAYHVWCGRLMLAFRRGENRHSTRWYRLFNEVPSVLLIAIVILAVVKPAFG